MKFHLFPKCNISFELKERGEGGRDERDGRDGRDGGGGKRGKRGDCTFQTCSAVILLLVNRDDPVLMISLHPSMASCNWA
jgi:hypothetical protein